MSFEKREDSIEINEEDKYGFLQKTEFIEKLIDSTSKISTKLNKNKLMKLLEKLVFSLGSSNSSEETEDQTFDNLDEYQIWAIIENSSKNIFSDLNKNLKTENYHKNIVKELKEKNTLLNGELLKKKREASETDKNQEGIEDVVNEKIDSEGQDEDLNNNNKKKKKREKETLIQDKYFDLEEFNNIGEDDIGDLALNEEDEIEQQEDFENLDKKNNGKNLEEKDIEGIKYEDFFDDRKLLNKKNNRFNNNNENPEMIDEDIEDNIFDLENKFLNNDKEGIKLTYEFVNDNGTSDDIEEIEKRMMEEKKWHMKGEIRGKERPKESLLENYLDFEVSIKPPPIPSAEITNNIEKMIRIRIKEDLFDDPIRHKQINLNKKSKEENQLNFEKSKKGLGEIYEDEYNLNQGNVSETEAKQLYVEIDDLTNKLYRIFDKLTNNSFVSGNRNTEMKVLTNIPAIQLEEISNFVTDNKSFAKSANEIYSRKDLETKTKDEMTKEEKEKLHKHTKRNIRNRLREKEKNQKMKSLMNKLDSKFEAKFTLKQMKDKNAKKNMKNSELKSSKFFDNIQNIANDDKDKKNNKSSLRNKNTDSTIFDLGSNYDAKNFKI